MDACSAPPVSPRQSSLHRVNFQCPLYHSCTSGRMRTLDSRKAYSEAALPLQQGLKSGLLHLDHLRIHNHHNIQTHGCSISWLHLHMLQCSHSQNCQNCCHSRFFVHLHFEEEGASKAFWMWTRKSTRRLTRGWMRRPAERWMPPHGGEIGKTTTSFTRVDQVAVVK